MEATNPRALINTEGQKHTLVITFVKRDGTKRRMVARYYGTPSRKPDQMVVWDMERGGFRTVTLSRVEDVKVCTRPAALKGEAKLEQLRREMAEIF